MSIVKKGEEPTAKDSLINYQEETINTLRVEVNDLSNQIRALRMELAQYKAREELKDEFVKKNINPNYTYNGIHKY
jgi:hypothetical protein